MFLSLVRGRQSTFEFSREPVKKKDLALILEAARWAPSSWNVQPWKFIVVENPDAVQALNRICPFGGFHENPPLIVALVFPGSARAGPKVRGVQTDKVGETEGLLSISLPAYNMCHMAHALKVASALLTPEPEKAASILNLGKGDFCPIMVALGHGKKGAFKRERGRLPLGQLVTYVK